MALAAAHPIAHPIAPCASQTIFLLNLVEEFEDSIPATFKPSAARRHTLRCSDIVLTGPRTRVVAHNEDSGAEDVNHTAIVTAKIGSNPKFVAYTYLGDLPSGAFGFNANGVAFTLNCAVRRLVFCLRTLSNRGELTVALCGRCAP